MSSNILFIFEGEKTEKQIVDNLSKFFISENSIIQCAYCTNLYHLHKEISEDLDLDTFSLLKSKAQNNKTLSSFNRDDFAEIYMFFDYDGHDPIATDEKIQETLDFFNEETDKGKLFISYPMVEALKHFSKDTNYKELKVLCKENIRYKHLVSTQCDKTLINFTEYKKTDWINLIELNLKKNELYSY